MPRSSASLLRCGPWCARRPWRVRMRHRWRWRPELDGGDRMQTNQRLPPNPFDPGYFGSDELRRLGFRAVGERVRIAKNATLIGLSHMAIGNDVRIDGNVVIAAHAGSLQLGSHIHIGEGCYLRLCRRHRVGRLCRAFARCADLLGHRRLQRERFDQSDGPGRSARRPGWRLCGSAGTSSSARAAWCCPVW